MSKSQALNVLEISASAKQEGSISRMLTADLIAALEDRHGNISLRRRDVAAGLPFVHEQWIAANYTPADERTPRQSEVLAQSDELVDELFDADVLVIGAPIYNFSIPAALKAWIDLIARARLTFRYTDTGMEGLIKGKKAYVVVPSGGVRIGSTVDYATPYLRHALGFVGITDIDFIDAPGADRDNGEALDAARARIAELVHLPPRAA